MMSIVEIPPESLPLYDGLPSRFEVRSILRVEAAAHGLGGFTFVREDLAAPYVKDYDAGGESRPGRWAARFDLKRFGLFLARMGDRAVGGAAVHRFGYVGCADVADEAMLVWYLDL